MSAKRKIRVLVVDDSAVARRAIRDALAQDSEIEVVDVACDAYVAREKILKLQPDVITLDLEMPRMDGLTFLRILNQHHPLPVVVVSSLTPRGSAKAMEALAAGAVDVLAKPNGSQTLGEVAYQLAFHVKAAARARLRPQPETGVSVVPPVANTVPAGEFSPRRIILIGASTGGVEALVVDSRTLIRELVGAVVLEIGRLEDQRHRELLGELLQALRGRAHERLTLDHAGAADPRERQTGAEPHATGRGVADLHGLHGLHALPLPASAAELSPRPRGRLAQLGEHRGL